MLTTPIKQLFILGLILCTAHICSAKNPANWDDFQVPDGIDPEFEEAWYNIPFHGCTYYFFDNFPIAISDEGWSVDENESLIIGPLMQGDFSKFNWDYRGQGKWDCAFWVRYTSSISIVNKHIRRFTSMEQTPETMRYADEAKVLRAYYYLQLVKWHGDAPIFTEPLEKDEDYRGIIRNPSVDVLKFVVSECDDVLSRTNLPWHLSGIEEADRMTLAIACAIKSEAALFAASPLHCRDEKLWEWAYQKNLEAFNHLIANGYALYTELQDSKAYSSAYQEYHATLSYAGKVAIDKETIWGANRVLMPWYTINAMPVLGEGTFKAGTIPTQELVDAYDMLATGKPIYDLRKPYLDEKHLAPNYDLSSGYDPHNPYAGRDPRFAASIYYDQCKVNTGVLNKTVRTYNNTAAVDDNGNIIDGAGSGSRANCGIDKLERRFTRTGYYNRKRHGYKANHISGKPEGNWKHFHLAEVYLNLAEAAIEAGHIDEGLKLINDIRHRAGFAPSVDVQASDRDYARLLVRHERQVELAFEEHRFFDCRRWKNPGSEISEERYKTGMWITTDPQSDKKDIRYTRFVLQILTDHNTASTNTTSSSHLLLPIPEEEVEHWAKLTGTRTDDWQNPGYNKSGDSGINDITADSDATVIATHYFDMQGHRLKNEPATGLYIRQDIKADNSVRTYKIIK